MKITVKLLPILGILILTGCAGITGVNGENQFAVNRSFDLHNVIIPIYHKDL